MDRELNLENEKELTALGKALSQKFGSESSICWETVLCV